MAQVLLDNDFKLHGWPHNIMSDRDNELLNEFRQSLFTIQGSTSFYGLIYHPHADGQTKIVNKCLETYLRSMCTKSPNECNKWLPLVE